MSSNIIFFDLLLKSSETEMRRILIRQSKKGCGERSSFDGRIQDDLAKGSHRSLYAPLRR